MSIAGTLSGLGVGSVFAGSAGEVTWSIAGSFVGTVVLERDMSGGQIAWVPMENQSIITGAASGSFASPGNLSYRFRCTKYTSGTIGYIFQPPAVARSPADPAAVAAARMGVVAAPISPAQGAAIPFDWSNYASGTFVENITGWTRTGGNPGSIRVGVSAGTLDFASGSDVVYTYDVGSRVHDVETTFTASSPTNFPLCIRVVDANNFIGMRVNSGTNRIEVYQRLAGTFTQLIFMGTQTGTPPLDRYRIEARGDDTVALYCEGLLAGTAAIPSALSASTKIGMVVHAATSTASLGAFNAYVGARVQGSAAGTACWFAEPRAVSASNKTWTGLVYQDFPNQNHGAIRIAQIDHTNGATTTYTLISGTNWPDDHNNPTILIRPDGRLVAFYCQHIDSNGIRYRISVNAYDASAWGAETIFAVPAAGGTCYPSPFMLSAESNKVYVFFRDGDNNISYVTSTDLATVAAPASDGAAQTAATWSTLSVALPTPGGPSTKGIYHRPTSNGVDRIDFAATYAQAAQAGAKVDVRHAYYKSSAFNTSAGQPLGLASGLGTAATTTFSAASGATVITVASATNIVVGMSVCACSWIPSGTTVTAVSGTSITISAATLILASSAAVTFLPYTFSTLTPIATSGAPDNMGDVWVWDTVRDAQTGIIQVVFAQFTTAGSAYPHVYWYARWDGVAWAKTLIPDTSTGSLTPAATTVEGYYSPGVCLDPAEQGVVYASVGGAAGTSCILYRYLTLDAGVSWTYTRVSPASVSGDTYSGQDFRPYVPRNRDRRAGVIWSRGRYNHYTWDATESLRGLGGSFHCGLMVAPV